MQLVRRFAAKPFVVMPLVAVLGLGAWWGLRSDDGADSGTAGAADQVVEATTGPMALTVSAEGTVAAAETDDLSFTSAGTVTAVNVSAGDVVRAGQVLATIDSAELEAAVADAEADVADAEAALADDEDAGASDEQIDADQSRLTSAEDGLASAQEQLAGAQLVASFDGTVASVDITVGEELASGGAGGTALTGSQTGTGQSAGTIGESDTQGLPTNTEQETSATPHIQVVSAGTFTVELGVDDTDIERLEVGQTATVSLSTASSTTGFGPPGGGGFPGGGEFPGGGSAAGGFPGGGALPGGDEPSAEGDAGGGEDDAPTEAGAVPGGAEASGELTDVGAMADASSGVASYPVTVAFTDDSGDFNVGATVTVEITYDEREDVVQVPAMAVTTADGTSTVTVRSDDGDEERTVDTGLTSGSMVEITSGLEAGEQVVVTVPGARGRARRWAARLQRRQRLGRGPVNGHRQAVIVLDAVGKTYATGAQEVEALKGISLRIDHGEFVVIVGPSGSGKSTLMHILGCLDVATTGTLVLAGEPVDTLDEDRLADIRNRDIGFVFQQFNLLAHLGLPERRAAARLRRCRTR